MHCVTKKVDDLFRIVNALEKEYLPVSRFYILTLDVGLHRRACSWQDSLNILGVRLRTKKDYCGQHAGPCLARNAWKKHKITRYLEGADWVAFNDMLNDLCDKLKIEAKIWSERESIGRLYLRQGKLRCTHYRMQGALQIGQSWVESTEWHGNADEDDFTDKHFGHRRPMARSWYPEGTPGIPEYLMSKEADYIKQLREEHELEHVEA